MNSEREKENFISHNKNRNTMQHNWKYINQVAGCQNRHKPNKLATLWKQTNKQTHIKQKVKIYSGMQEIQNHIYNSSTNTIYNTHDFSS